MAGNYPLFYQDHLCVACNAKVMGVYGHHASVCAVKRSFVSNLSFGKDLVLQRCDSKTQITDAAATTYFA